MIIFGCVPHVRLLRLTDWQLDNKPSYWKILRANVSEWHPERAGVRTWVSQRFVCESLKLPLKPLEALVRQKVTKIHVLRLHRDNIICQT